jgi:hypothetical protein
VLGGHLESVEVQPPRLVIAARLSQERALLVAIGRQRLRHIRLEIEWEREEFCAKSVEHCCGCYGWSAVNQGRESEEADKRRKKKGTRFGV